MNGIMFSKPLSLHNAVEIGTSRSTAKLKPLHGAIANDIHQRLGSDYIIKSQGYGDDKEAKIDGRYVEKWVDITVIKRRTNKPVAGFRSAFEALRLHKGRECRTESNFQMSVNGNCLRHIFQWRRNHRLPMWHTFCDWICHLPYANELILVGLDTDGYPLEK
jgi:hypothetical protein